MASRFASCSYLLCVLLASQCTRNYGAREITGGTLKDVNKGANDLKQAGMDDHLRHQSFHMDPSFIVFFTADDVNVGRRIPIYFSVEDPSTAPPLIPREEADLIPFSSAQLPEILDLFSISKDSPQGKAMEFTLGQCEDAPLQGESKFCSTSLESMLDSVRAILGQEAELKVLTTKHLKAHTALLQNYTVLEAPREMTVRKMVACHTMPYPYEILYCHGQESDNKLLEFSLEGDNGERVEAPGVCHMDTSQWDPNHIAFRVLNTQPGGSPVCHFFAADNLIFVASPTTI